MGSRVILFILFTLISTMGAEAAVKDSVGVKVKSGKIFIMHKVDPGQGLYSVSRRYNVPIEAILAANPEVTEMLKKDQILLIPTGKDAPFEEKVVKEYFDEKKGTEAEGDSASHVISSTFARYYIVQSGETLFSIAKKFSTSVEVIKELNNINTDAISEGQRLLVPVREDGLPIEAEAGVGSKNKEERVTELEQELVQLRKRIQGDKTDTTKVKGKEVEQSVYDKRVDKVEKYDVVKVTEKGAMRIFTDQALDQEQRYASHHEAEIGTIIMVSNPSTGQSVFVKVIKNHTLNPDKSNMIILTESAAKRISVSNGATVEISYAR